MDNNMDRPTVGDYLYQTEKDLFDRFLIDLGAYIRPLQKSYDKSKPLCFLQTMNLTIFGLIVNSFLGKSLDRFVAKLTSVELPAVGYIGWRVVIILVGLAVVSAFKENKIIKWQTFYEMGKGLSFRVMLYFSLIYISVTSWILRYESNNTRNPSI